MLSVSTISLYAVIATVTFSVAQHEQAPLLPGPETRAAVCCQNLLEAGLEGKIHLPGSPLYSERMSSYWSVSAALRPWCIAQPSNAQDVSTILTTLVHNQCTFGIRSGGHSAFPGSSSVSKGVTIDFGNMNATTFDAETGLATIMPGGRWQDVYDALAPFGVTVTGGRAGSVGVGGFVTGGGNSFHSASHGMACDNVVNWEVVLADGSIVNANATHNAELWIALKGGSANFGLITKFDMYTISYPSQPVIWGGNLFFDTTSGPQAIDAFAKFADNVDKDQNSSSILWFGNIPEFGGKVLYAGVENTLAIPDAPAFDGYRNIGVVSDTTRVDAMSNITKELGDAGPPGYRVMWFTLSFGVDARILSFAAEKHDELYASLSSLLSNEEDAYLNTLLIFQPLHAIIAQHGREKGGNVMGLDYYTSRYGNGILFMLDVSVNGSKPTHETLVLPYVQAFVREVAEYADELGLLWDWKYLNYGGLGQDPMSTFGKSAIEKIQKASVKYDPMGVFQRLRGSGFKIPG